MVQLDATASRVLDRTGEHGESERGAIRRERGLRHARIARDRRSLEPCERTLSVREQTASGASTSEASRRIERAATPRVAGRERDDSPAHRAVRPDGNDAHAVTLVGAVVANGDARRRIRLADRTGGPVLPPRRRGVPEAGWTETGVELVLDPGETRAIGYATYGEPVDQPLVVAASESVSGKRTAVDERPRRNP